MSTARPHDSTSERDVDRLARRVRFRYLLSMSILSGLMLGFAFPPSPLGILACFGLVPLLLVISDCRTLGEMLRYSYLAMLIFHAITLAWTGGFSHGNDQYMMIAGTVTILVHPFFYYLPLIAYWWLRRAHGQAVALLGFPVFWVVYEYSHTLSEWSFPWLTLANTQTFDLARMQIANLTGVWGLSLWIVLMNIIAFLLYSRLARTPRMFGDRMVWAVLGGLVVLYAAPRIYGEFVLAGAPVGGPTGEKVRVGIIQPNTDPWDKWSQSGYESIRTYLRMTETLTSGSRPPEIVLWPETAIPYYILDARNDQLLRELRGAVDSLGVSILSGLPHAVFYDDTSVAPSTAKRERGSGRRYDSFNAAAFFQPGVHEIQWYGKMKMVPFAERVPYAEVLQGIDFLRWNVGIGGWQIGRDTTVFREAATGARFCAVICYESVYPDFVAAFVRKGAEFITIITIDSWWGKMSGAYQHQQFALLRAIENRRWVARCAVGGISSIIDPYGRVLERTDLFTRATLIHDIGRSSSLTFYSRYGDWLAVILTWIAGLLLASAAGKSFFRLIRKRQWQTNS